MQTSDLHPTNPTTADKASAPLHPEPLFSLVEGEIVTAKKALHNFVFAHTADGRSGWVERTQIQRVIPTPVSDRWAD